MEHEAEAAGPTAVIAARVRELRRGHDWTADQLAEQMTKVGIPWSRIVVTKLETGRRPSVSVEELLALAYVLDVAPVHLLVPLVDGDQAEPLVQILPTMTVPPGTARNWIRGEMPFGEVDHRRYFSQVPPEEFRRPYTSPVAGELVDGER